MAKINPYLTFNNNCREAMNFYKECLGGELSLMTVSESPVANQMPPQYKDAILHSELKSNGFSVMGSDMAPEALNDGNTNHMCLICETEEEIKSLFEKLSAGGKIKQPLHEMFFGLIGSLEDKYGKRWLLEYDKKS